MLRIDWQQAYTSQLKESSRLIAECDQAHAALAAVTARAENAEAKLAAVDAYVAYCVEAAAEGDAFYSFEDWYGGAAEAAEHARTPARLAEREALGDEAQP